MSLVVFIALLFGSGLARADDLVPVAATPFEIRRERVTKAILILRMGRTGKKDAVSIAVEELKTIPGITKDHALVLQMALGAQYWGLKEGTASPQQVRVSIADYDRKLAIAAEAAGLGRDYQSYLKTAYPHLLEGRLRASDALQPRFIQENAATVLALAQNNLQPFGDDYSHLLLAYFDRAGPLLAKVPEWRAGVREFLMNASPAQLETFGRGIGIEWDDRKRRGAWDSPYRTLFWDVGDIFADVAAVKKGSATEAALQRLAPGFPRNGVKDLAKQALSNTSTSVLTELERVSGVAMADFYAPLKIGIQAHKADGVSPEVLRRLFYFAIGRAGNYPPYRADIELMNQIVPILLQADADQLSDKDKRTILENIERKLEMLINSKLPPDPKDRAYVQHELKSAVEAGKITMEKVKFERAHAVDLARFEEKQRALKCQNWFAKLARAFKIKGH